MKILVACEESQAVTKELRRLGHEAYSCDIIDCSGGHPEWHIRQNVLTLLNPEELPFGGGAGIGFFTDDEAWHFIDGKWDMIIAFPPCTYLTVAGNRYFNVERYGDKARERIRLSEEAEDGKILSWNDPRTARVRSKTYSGIAEAMAEQWGGECK